MWAEQTNGRTFKKKNVSEFKIFKKEKKKKSHINVVWPSHVHHKAISCPQFLRLTGVLLKEKESGCLSLNI